MNGVSGVKDANSVKGVNGVNGIAGGASRGGLAAVLLLAAPVLAGILYSLAAAVGLAGAGARGFTLDHVTAVLTASETWRGVLWTLWTAGVATAIASALALVAATLLVRARITRLIALLPLALPHAAGALAILLLFAQSGLLARVGYRAGWLTTPADFPALVYDRPGVGLILAFVWKELPFLTFAALAVREARTRALEEAAHTLGASAWQTWRRVTAPLLARGLAPSAIAVLAFLLGQYEMALILAPSDPLPLALLTAERATDPDVTRRGEAHVLALLAFGMAIVLVVLYERFRAHREATA